MQVACSRPVGAGRRQAGSPQHVGTMSATTKVGEGLWAKKANKWEAKPTPKASCSLGLLCQALYSQHPRPRSPTEGPWKDRTVHLDQEYPVQWGKDMGG